jgi:hypothetical protein
MSDQAAADHQQGLGPDPRVPGSPSSSSSETDNSDSTGYPDLPSVGLTSSIDSLMANLPSPMLNAGFPVFEICKGI